MSAMSGKRTLRVRERWPKVERVCGVGEFVAFQPFGYRFEVRSPSAPSDLTATIRSRKKGWLDPKNGARGWIVGPFICLWFSAFNGYGPMLFGRISRDNLGTRITGRAGSDLNGLALSSVLLPLMALLLYQMVSAGDYTANQLIIIGGVILLSPLIFWWSHKDRREAEPLVRFLRDTVSISGRTLRAKSASVTVSKALILNVGGENRVGPVTAEAIHDALVGLGAGDFVILELGSETYIQTASRDGGYAIEMREGDNQRHFQAVRRSSASAAAVGANVIFTLEEVLAAFMAYASEGPMPHFLMRERLHLAE